MIKEFALVSSLLFNVNNISTFEYRNGDNIISFDLTALKESYSDIIINSVVLMTDESSYYVSNGFNSSYYAYFSTYSENPTSNDLMTRNGYVFSYKSDVAVFSGTNAFQNHIIRLNISCTTSYDLSSELANGFLFNLYDKYGVDIVQEMGVSYNNPYQTIHLDLGYTLSADEYVSNVMKVDDYKNTIYGMIGNIIVAPFTMISGLLDYHIFGGLNFNFTLKTIIFGIVFIILIIYIIRIAIFGSKKGE